MPDIDKGPFDEQGYIKLPITEQSVMDYKKLGLKPSLADLDTQIKKKQAYLIVRVVDMTRFDSMVVLNPNRDVIEDRRKKQGYSLKEIKTVMTRMKLLIFCYEWLKTVDREVVYFDYPRYSAMWYFCLMFFTYYFDPAYLLSYLTLWMLILVLSHSDFWRAHIKPILKRYFFNDTLRNAMLFETHSVRTSNEIYEDKTQQELREEQGKIKEIHKDYNIKDKNMYAKLRDLKRGSTGTLNAMDSVCDAYEKTKNLIRWEQKRMTFFFSLFAFALFLIVTFFPLRTLIMVYLTYKFNRGREYHKRRVRNNREVLLIEYTIYLYQYNNFLEDNKALLLRSQVAPANSTPVQQQVAVAAGSGHLGEKWEVIIGKAMTYKVFEQKLYAHFQDSFKYTNILQISIYKII